GLKADASTVAMYQSALTGGPGGFGHICSEVADGGAGLRAIGASVLISGCTLTGGGEGPGPPAGTPGAGLRGDASSSLEWHDSTAVAAPGGIDVDVAPGTLTSYAGITRVFSLTSPLREGQFGTLTLQGLQGDFVGFFWSFGSSFVPKPAKNGWFLLGPPFVSGPYFIGAIGNPDGAWSIPIHAPALQPALQAQTFLLQAWFQYPGGVTLASGTAFTVLDASL
ncbi:MAG TPA: hypothetical protein VFF36_17265, partial [Planctomycetota bacterium]|nr:hypothetical protein [Planctomycetota bacterium]